MQLYSLLSSLYQEKELPSINSYVNKSTIAREITNQEQVHRNLVAQQRLSIFCNNQNSFNAEDLVIHKEYQQLLKWLDKYCLENYEYHETILLINYFLTQESSPNNYIQRLFVNLFDSDFNLAINFYNDLKNGVIREGDSAERENILRNFNNYFIDFAVNVVRVHVQIFLQKFQLQQSFYPVLPCVASYADKIEEFAALIIWLKESGCEDDEIIVANLLEDFMLYYFSDTTFYHSTQYYPMQLLFNILENFAITQSLCVRASQIKCNNRAISNYYLNGKPAENREYTEDCKLPEDYKQTLINKINTEVLNFSVEVENFISLYKVFKVPILRVYLSWANKAHFADRDILATAFLRFEPQDISELIYLLVDQNNAAFLRLFVNLFNHIETLLDHLTAANSGAVLYLFDYLNYFDTRTLARKIDIDIAKEFMREMLFRKIDIGDIHNELKALLKAPLPNPVARFLFSTLLDEALVTAKYINEDLFIQCTFEGKEEIIKTKIDELDAIYISNLLQETADLPFTEEKFNYISDIWNELKLKITFLKNIAPEDFVLKMEIPADIYKLQASIVNNLVAQHQENFSIEMFADIMNELFLPYDNTKTTIFAMVDSPIIREHLLTTLNKEDLNLNHLFMLAAQSGNVGFLEWLDNENYFSHHIKDIIGQGAVSAANVDKWNVARYLCTKFKEIINQSYKAKILTLAANNNQWEFLPLLYSHHKPPPYVVQEVFLKAVENECIEILPKFREMNLLSDTLIITAFRKAITDTHYSVLNILAGLKENRLLQQTMENELIKAVDHENIDLVQTLFAIDDYFIAPQVINRALKKAQALHNNQLADILFLKLESISSPHNEDLENHAFTMSF